MKRRNRLLSALLSCLLLFSLFSTTALASVDKGIHNKTTKYGLPTY